ncbi:hypothetical protein BC940DRAFT_314359 [Gongronella butleri]|nr:hypothetical protein BC940DRAFT_314359 [Gongronella butleri]
MLIEKNQKARRHGTSFFFSLYPTFFFLFLAMATPHTPYVVPAVPCSGERHTLSPMQMDPQRDASSAAGSACHHAHPPSSLPGIGALLAVLPKVTPAEELLLRQFASLDKVSAREHIAQIVKHAQGHRHVDALQKLYRRQNKTTLKLIEKFTGDYASRRGVQKHTRRHNKKQHRHVSKTRDGDQSQGSNNDAPHDINGSHEGNLPLGGGPLFGAASPNPPNGGMEAFRHVDGCPMNATANPIPLSADPTQAAQQWAAIHASLQHARSTSIELQRMLATHRTQVASVTPAALELITKRLEALGKTMDMQHQAQQELNQVINRLLPNLTVQATVTEKINLNQHHQHQHQRQQHQPTPNAFAAQKAAKQKVLSTDMTLTQHFSPSSKLETAVPILSTPPLVFCHYQAEQQRRCASSTLPVIQQQPKTSTSATTAKHQEHNNTRKTRVAPKKGKEKQVE